jgi:hypothetical protein
MNSVRTVWGQLSARKVGAAARAATMLRDMSQLLVLFACIALLVLAAPADFAALPLPVIYIAIFAVSDAQNRHLVARLSRTQPPLVSPLTLPLLLLSALLAVPRLGLQAPPLSYAQVMIGAAVLFGVGYLRFARAVIGEITAYLGLFCFSMKRRAVVRASVRGA